MTRRIVYRTKLYANPKCWEFQDQYPDDWEAFGCGPGKWGDWLVPDHIIRVSVREACRIHDWYYRFHETNSEDDRAQADRIFLNNMLRIVDAIPASRFIRWLRRWTCRRYYLAVRRYGGPAYHNDRNKDNEFRKVVI